MKFKQYIANVFIVVCLLAILLLMLLPPKLNPHKHTPIAICRLELVDIKNALAGYQSKYSNFPIGNQAQVIASLCGDNPLRYQFLDVHVLQFSSNKECLDPWGTPLRIDFTSTNSAIISSAGKDKIFGDADDIVFNSVSNDFVKP